MAPTLSLMVEIEVDMALVEALVSKHLTSLTRNGTRPALSNGHAASTGAQTPEKETSAPVLPSSTGAP